MKNSETVKSYLSFIPPVHKILNFPEVQKLIDQYGQPLVVSIRRTILSDYRNDLKYVNRINNEIFFDEEIIKQSEITFLEGYLWDKGDPQKAFNKAINNSKQSAMSLSDLFCVERHKEFFLDLVQKKLSITFANEQEIIALINAKDFSEVVEFAKKIKKLIIITRGENGAIAIHNDNVVECSAKKGLEIKDLTGAGDLFAAGFLHGYVNKLSIKESLEKGTELSTKIIQQVGARL